MGTPGWQSSGLPSTSTTPASRTTTATCRSTRRSCPDGPAAYFATLPIKAIVAAIREGGLPASVSNSAGTFVCNHLMYGLLHAADHHYPTMRAGFIHVPYLPSQVVDKHDQPGMALGDIVQALELAVEAAVRDRASGRDPA